MPFVPAKAGTQGGERTRWSCRSGFPLAPDRGRGRAREWTEFGL